METAALAPWSIGSHFGATGQSKTVLIVSKAAKAHGPFDFYDLDLITEGGGVTTTEEHLGTDGFSVSRRRLPGRAPARPKALHFKLRVGPRGALEA